MHRATQQFDRRADALADVLAFVDRFFAHIGRKPDEAVLFVFVAEELFTNMVKYNPDGPPTVSASMQEENGRCTLVMEDHSHTPFDLTQAPMVDIDRPINERKPGGLGIHLIRTMMDEVTYSFENGTSRTTVVKNMENSHV